MRRVISFVVLGLVASLNANANKCSFKHYVVLGNVSNVTYQEASGEIRIHLFLGDRSYTSDYPVDRNVDYVLPNPDGNFEIDAWASSEVGDSGQRCTEKPLHGTLVISGKGIKSLRLRVDFQASKDPRGFISNHPIRIKLVPIE
jgi:hypothetical protein